MAKEIETLSEDERRALRGSKFAPLPPRAPSRTQPRLAHPGGPLATNKAAALAKFLERKLKEPNGMANINPDLLELAVNNAKQTVYASSCSGTSNSKRTVRHVESFGDPDSKDSSEEQNELFEVKEHTKKKKKKKKEKKKNKKRKDVEDPGCAVVKKPKQNFKF